MAESIDALRERIRLARSVSDAVQSELQETSSDQLGSFLSRLDDLLRELSGSYPGQSQVAGYAMLEVYSPDFDRLQDLFASADYDSISAWIQVMESKFVAVLQNALSRIEDEESDDPFLGPDARSILKSAIDAWERDTTARRYVDDARAAATRAREQALALDEFVLEARSSAALAAEAAGSAGGASIGGHFRRLADRELRTADLFRVATIAIFVIALGGAIYYSTLDFSIEKSISHGVLVLSGLAGATFLGAQASGHRRTGNWARAIEVQLESFPAFVEPIRSSSTVEGLYELLGKRVLSALPKDRGGESSSESASLIKAVEILLKQQR